MNDLRCFEHHAHGPECYGESITTRKLRALAAQNDPRERELSTLRASLASAEERGAAATRDYEKGQFKWTGTLHALAGQIQKTKAAEERAREAEAKLTVMSGVLRECRCLVLYAAEGSRIDTPRFFAAARAAATLLETKGEGE